MLEKATNLMNSFSQIYPHLFKHSYDKFMLTIKSYIIIHSASSALVVSHSCVILSYVATNSLQIACKVNVCVVFFVQLLYIVYPSRKLDLA